MTEVKTYRLSATGVWSYEFYTDAGRMIGTVSSVVAPSAPVYVKNAHYHWHSALPIDRTVISGTGRCVNDNVTGEEMFRLIYWRPGLYEIKGEDVSLQVELHDGRYLFGKAGMPVLATMERIEEKVVGTDVDVEAFARTIFYEETSERIELMILSFPALKFY